MNCLRFPARNIVFEILMQYIARLAQIVVDFSEKLSRGLGLKLKVAQFLLSTTYQIINHILCSTHVSPIN